MTARVRLAACACSRTSRAARAAPPHQAEQPRCACPRAGGPPRQAETHSLFSQRSAIFLAASCAPLFYGHLRTGPIQGMTPGRETRQARPAWEGPRITRARHV